MITPLVKGSLVSDSNQVTYSVADEIVLPVLVMSIYAVDGSLRATKQVRLAGSVSMNITFLQKGLYFVKITSENVSTYTRLVIAQ
jgi:hypothetical protein